MAAVLLTMVTSVRLPSRTLPTQVSLNSQRTRRDPSATEYAPSPPIQPSRRSNRADSSGAGRASATVSGSAPAASIRVVSSVVMGSVLLFAATATTRRSREAELHGNAQQLTRRLLLIRHRSLRIWL